MRVWLITVGEPLPTDKGNERLFRSGILADLLARNGHEAVLWSSTFNHAKKAFRANEDTRLEVRPGYELKLLHSGIGYKKNISFRRILNHRGVAKEFRKQAEIAARPDVILCSLPTLELCVEATRFGQKHGIPVVLDVRDLWPTLFLDLIPQFAQPVARIVLNGMFRQAKFACTQATAITGITEEYVEWGVNFSGRPHGVCDRPFPMGYVEYEPSQQDVERADLFWRQQGLAASGDESEFIACWFGMFGRHSEIATVIDAAARLEQTHKSIRFVLCGVGPHLDKCRKLAGELRNVVMPGWVDAPQIWTLLRKSSVGLTPYVSNENYRRNVPNKPVEYLSAGLPIVSSLQGVLASLLKENSCGVTYQNEQSGELAKALSSLYENPQQRLEMARNAKHLYQTEFVAENVYSKMQDYLVDIAGAHMRSFAA
jgi:glycosyltransferase involved in cell wall biosynthesis